MDEPVHHLTLRYSNPPHAQLLAAAASGPSAAALADYMEDVTNILVTCLGDSYHEIKKSACAAITALCAVLPRAALEAASLPLMRALCANLGHRHSQARRPAELPPHAFRMHSARLAFRPGPRSAPPLSQPRSPAVPAAGSPGLSLLALHRRATAALARRPSPPLPPFTAALHRRCRP